MVNCVAVYCHSSKIELDWAVSPKITQKQPFQDVLQNRCSIFFLQSSQENTCTGVPGISYQKEIQRRCFPVNIVKFFRIAFLQNTSRWLLLKAIFQMFLSWCLVFFGNFPAYVLSWVYLSHWGSRVLPST